MNCVLLWFTGLDGQCRLNSPFPFGVGSNPNWPDGNVSAILGVPIIQFPDVNAEEEGEEEEVAESVSRSHMF